MYKSLGSDLARLATAALLFGALDRQPYGYYTILRWVTCIVAAYTAVQAYEQHQRGITWVFTALALLFNPIFPVYLVRKTWAPVDVLSAALLMIAIFALRRQKNLMGVTDREANPCGGLQDPRPSPRCNSEMPSESNLD